MGHLQTYLQGARPARPNPPPGLWQAVWQHGEGGPRALLGASEEREVALDHLSSPEAPLVAGDLAFLRSPEGAVQGTWVRGEEGGMVALPKCGPGRSGRVSKDDREADWWAWWHEAEEAEPLLLAAGKAGVAHRRLVGAALVPILEAVEDFAEARTWAGLARDVLVDYASGRGKPVSRLTVLAWGDAASYAGETNHPAGDALRFLGDEIEVHNVASTAQGEWGWSLLDALRSAEDALARRCPRSFDRARRRRARACPERYVADRLREALPFREVLLTAARTHAR